MIQITNRPLDNPFDHARGSAQHNSLPWRIIDLIQWGTRYFTDRNISNARLEVEWLLAHQLGLERIDLYVQHDRGLTSRELAGFKGLVRRRVVGEPFQYILGKAPFYGHDFLVTPAVLIPRPETETLIQVLRQASSPELILDIGTGSGCLAITAALLYPDAQVTAVDISQAALAVAEENARRLEAANVTFQKRDILKALLKGRFDSILCNPPYVAADEMTMLQREIREHEPLSALTDGNDGLTWFRRLAEIGPGLLEGAGRMIVEIGGSCQAEPVRAIFEAAGAEVTLHRDLQGEPRAYEGRWEK
ncbi:MAG: peptide chain release factor N(5)-glutamine methyltransferase [Fidelibacterota bacterium]|nr:MAG: peptide chain release factor N(5)-glutamine methyltransferase [Candidatus Neomarinimicrobiota bacterium]